MSADEYNANKSEAKDIIDELHGLATGGKTGCPPEIVKAHTRALVWIIRRLDLAPTPPWVLLASKAGPIGMVCATVCWIGWIFAKARGLLP